MITKTGGLALLVPALLLSACLSVPIELKVNPTLTADGANLSTIQFKERDREKAFRVIREFAGGQRMEPLPPGKSVLGAGWAQEQHQLRVKVSGLLYDTEHTIILTLLYKDGNATVHLLMKWERAGDRVVTAEVFIEKIGSRSSMSGKPYLVVLPGGRTLESGPWLSGLLRAVEPRAPQAP